MTAETVAIRVGVTANTVRRSVSRDGVEIFLTPQLFKIFMHVSTARYGMTPAQLFDAIYADDPNGGPLTGRKCVQCQRVHLNRKLARIGLRITSAGQGSTERPYTLSIWLRPPRTCEWPAADDGQMRLSDLGYFDDSPTTEDERA